MTVHHQAHRERIDAGLGFEWNKLPPFVEHASEVPPQARQVRFRRVGKTHRGIFKLAGVQSLWGYAVDQDFLEEICSLRTLELLYIEKVTASNLAAINRLPRLRSLSVIGATKVKDLSWIPTHPSLRSLALENLKEVRDLAPLSQLTQLQALGVEGSMWTPMQASSLAPLSALHQLQWLFMTNLRVKDYSLQPLHDLRHLKVLQCARFFPKEEFRRLAEARPTLQCDWFDVEHWRRTT